MEKSFKFQRVVRRSCNSRTITIPRDTAVAYGVNIGDIVEVTIKKTGRKYIKKTA